MRYAGAVAKKAAKQDKKGKVKRQHFVPRCLLRRFSPDERTLSVFVVGKTTYVPIAGVSTQCAADYFYGSDQRVEGNLGNLETAFSGAVGDMSVSRLNGLTGEQLAVVRSFVHVQAERTPLATDAHRDMFINMGTQLYSAYAKMNGLPLDGIAERAESFADAHIGVAGAFAVDAAIKHQVGIDDLEVKFLVGDRLIISDHPVLALNLWRDSHPRFASWPVLGGLKTKGFLYIMPLATNRAAIVYDAAVYRVGDRDGLTAVVTAEDVRNLNALQTINAEQLLFDNTAVAPEDLIAALTIRAVVRAQQGDGRLPLRPAGIEFSFLEIMDKDAHEGWNLAMLPARGGYASGAPSRLR